MAYTPIVISRKFHLSYKSRPPQIHPSCPNCYRFVFQTAQKRKKERKKEGKRKSKKTQTDPAQLYDVIQKSQIKKVWRKKIAYRTRVIPSTRSWCSIKLIYSVSVKMPQEVYGNQFNSIYKHVNHIKSLEWISTPVQSDSNDVRPDSWQYINRNSIKVDPVPLDSMLINWVIYLLFDIVLAGGRATSQDNSNNAKYKWHVWIINFGRLCTQDKQKAKTCLSSSPERYFDA